MTMHIKCLIFYLTKMSLQFSELEKKNVIDAYSSIADSFDVTRVNIWPCVKLILDGLDKSLSICDVGCANGKTISYLLKNNFISVKGCDICPEFVKICKDKSYDVVEGNILCLPYEDKSFDVIVCTAVIHHLDNDEKRTKAIDELVRITKPNGKIILSVASFEKQFYKEKYDVQDAMIPWKNSSGSHIVDRYYRLFKEGELEKLCVNPEIKAITCKESKFNWLIVIEKK